MDKLDRRSAEARFLADVRAELALHVGGNPSATQRAMIERAAWLRLHIRLMDILIVHANSWADQWQTRT